MKDHNSHKYKGVGLGFWHQLLQIDLIRYIISRLRFFYFVKVRRNLRTLDQTNDQEVADNTVSHNLKGIKDYAAVRPLALVKPLSVIESLSKDAKVLTIGPRSEGEMLALIGYGFMPKNIRGLDLISYSPWVDIGDMHHMPYEDSTYDAVVMGWVIAYSESPEMAAKEVARVTKLGGVVAVGVEYGGVIGQEQIKKLGYVPGAGRLTTDAQQLLDFFGEHVDQVYFSHSITKDRMEHKGSVIAIFSIKK